jgi:hypothetical protein
VQGKVTNAAVSAYVVELEQFNNHPNALSPFFCWVESMSCPFCVNCQVLDSAFRFPLPLGLESLKLYYDTYSRTPSKVRQFCKIEYFLKLTEKRYKEHPEELDNCVYWDIEIVTAIVNYNVHELQPSYIHVIVESQDLKDWNTEHLYPSDCYYYLQPSLEFLIVVYLQTHHHQHYVLYCFDLNEGIVEVRDPDHGVSLESHLKCIHEIAHKYLICPGFDIDEELIPSKMWSS